MLQPIRSSRRHVSYNDCLENEEKLSELFCAVLYNSCAFV